MISPAAQFANALAVAKRTQRLGARAARLPRKLPPKGIEADYLKAFRPLLAEALAMIERELVPILPSLVARRDATDQLGARRDAGRLSELLDRLSKEFYDRLRPEQIEKLAAEFAKRTEKWEKQENAKQVKAAFGVDVLTREPALAAKTGGFVAENVALIKDVPNKFFADVESRVARAVRDGKRPEDLAKEIREAHGVSERRAALIARDQIGKFFGEVAQARQTAMGVKSYVWRTANDERVRDEHAEREGEVFDWDNPPDDGHPGQAISCRCFSEPLLTDLLEGTEPIARAYPTSRPEFEVETIRSVPTPRGFDVGEREIDGKGVPTYESLAAGDKSPLNVVRPSDLLGKVFAFENTRVGNVAKIEQAWDDGKKLPPLKITVDEKGNMFVDDGRHRLIAALVEGKDRKLVVEFEHAPKGVDLTKQAVPVTAELKK